MFVFGLLDLGLIFVLQQVLITPGRPCHLYIPFFILFASSPINLSICCVNCDLGLKIDVFASEPKDDVFASNPKNDVFANGL